MVSLSDVIDQPDRRRQVVDDATHVLDQEVSDKGGVSGLAIKGAFAMVKALKPGIIPEVIEGLLPDFAKALDPILAQRQPSQGIGSFLEGRTDQVVQALLSVTDERAQKSTHQTLIKAYQKLRPTAEKHVATAIPRVSKMVAAHVERLEKSQATPQSQPQPPVQA